MRIAIFLIFSILFSPCLAVYADNNANPFDAKVNDILNAHYLAYKDKEYFSGIALSIYVPDQPIKNYYIGQTSHQKDSKKISADTLFEIGSITKSFTAAIILQLEKENKLKLTDKMQDWLPEYNKWSQLTLTSLLNMTSGLPNYSDAPIMNAEQFKRPTHSWTNKELVAFVYPKGIFSPPLKSGYFYSNTGYILAAMIIEKVTKNKFQSEIENRLIKPLALTNTFYPLANLNKQTFARLADGYAYNQYVNPELVGQNIKAHSLSWAGAAGAVISNSTDIIKWIKALFIEDKILDTQQKILLEKINSTVTNKAISQTSQENSRAFGLGVSQAFDPNIGPFWFYEGETEGFRALYMYVPKTGIIVASIFNSAVNEENDHAGELMKNVYRLASSQSV